MNASCLDDELIARIARGLVPEAELSTADDHLDGCEVCRRVLASLVNEGAHDSRMVGERYELGALVGAGAHGLVWEARDVKLERRVAVKLMRHQSNAPLSEARLMARVSHPSVVQVFDVGDRFVAMEFVGGPTLRTWLAKQQPLAERLRVMREAGDALAAVHRSGLVHRDFKPDNVLIDASGRARVTDFGLAQTEGDGSVGGTPAYMAPEQLAGKAGDQKSDQYAFCVTLFEALAGKRPGKGELPSEISSSVQSVIERGLSKDPHARFASMDELLVTFNTPPRSRWPWFAALAAVLVLSISLAATLNSTTPTPELKPVAPPQPKSNAPPTEKKAAPTKALQLDRDFLEEEPLIETLPPAGSEIALAAGCVRSFKPPRATRVFIEDDFIVNVAGNADELQFIARTFGTTKVSLETNGKKRTWTVVVREPKEVAATRVQLKPEQTYSVETIGLHRLSIGDSSVVDVSSREGGTVTFQALKAGRTNALLWTNDAQRIEVVFEVAAPGPGVVQLEVGVQHVLKVEPFDKVRVKPEGRVSVEIVGYTEVLLLPREVGEGTLEFLDDDGKPVESRAFRVR
ncbi:MAG: serine/threonine protein kinase [Archangium sp.]|nr:serine/threonine protein kinase [Archangium sp.]